MGNTQGPLQGRRERHDSSGTGRRSTMSASDDDPSAILGGLEMKIGGKGSPHASVHSMQFENASEYPVVIKYAGNAKHVTIAGSWDGWRRKIPLAKSTDDFTTIINLPEGRHEFKFNVDGHWICDHNLPRGQTATDGGPAAAAAGSASDESNVIVIDKADFEVFDALDKDSQATSGAAGKDGSSASDGSDGKGSDGLGGEKTYCQEAPDRRLFEKTAQPPVLPPHLLQVILNKDTPVSCDPNVLPEPNHVMLNHLYALSIKDGVMVLSATHRYRKKYVTTLLYKPI